MTKSNAFFSICSDVQPTVNEFSLNFFIDGLPLHKSTRKQFWPILMSIHEMPEVPVLMVGNFYGQSKPKSLDEYLRPLVEELNELIDNGIKIAKKTIKIIIRAFIADAPARAFIKGVAYFNHKLGCQRCTVEGQFNKKARVMYFSKIDAPRRTDEEFRGEKYGDHHRERTPLLHLKTIDIIRNIIIADVLHLIDFGISRTLIVGWKSGKLIGRSWSSETLNYINSLLQKVEIPPEYHRKFRRIEDTGLWKAIEYHMFLHYASFIVLKNVLTEMEYKHYMLYFCAIRAFSSEIYKHFWPEADRLLKQFVVEYGVIYGEHRLTSNVHSLVHVFEDVDKFGVLKNMSSYRFEGTLFHVKNSLRNGHQVLVQAANRISEQSSKSRTARNNSYPYLEHVKKGVVLHVNYNTTFYPTSQANWFLTKDNYIVQYCRATQVGSVINIYGKAFDKIISPDKYCSSPLMEDIYEAEVNDLSTQEMVFLIEDIKCKLVAIKTDDSNYVFVPLIDTLMK